MAELMAKILLRVLELLTADGPVTDEIKNELAHVATIIDNIWTVIKTQTEELKSLTPAQALLVVDEDSEFREQLAEFGQQYSLIGFLSQSLLTIAAINKSDVMSSDAFPEANVDVLRAILARKINTLAEYRAHSGQVLAAGIFCHKYLESVIKNFIDLLAEKLHTGAMSAPVVVAALNNIRPILRESTHKHVSDLFELYGCLIIMSALLVGDVHGSRAAVIESGDTPEELVAEMRQLIAANPWWSAADVADCEYCITQMRDTFGVQ